MKIRGALQTDAKAIAEIYNIDLGYETDEKQIFDRLGKIDENREAVFVPAFAWKKSWTGGGNRRKSCGCFAYRKIFHTLLQRYCQYTKSCGKRQTSPWGCR